MPSFDNGPAILRATSTGHQCILVLHPIADGLPIDTEDRIAFLNTGGLCGTDNGLFVGIDNRLGDIADFGSFDDFSTDTP
jgi:hypothetical protein